MRGILAALAAAVAVAALGVNVYRAGAQEETPPLPDMFMINSTPCIALESDIGATTCQLFNKTVALGTTRDSWTALLDEDGDGEVTREEVARLDLDANHLHQEDGSVLIVLFVDDDDPVRFETDAGEFKVTGSLFDQAFLCDQPSPGSQSMRVDEDCDNDGIDGDGLLYAQLDGRDFPQGTGTVRAISHSTLIQLAELQFTIVGEPDEVSASILESSILEGIDPDDPEACELPTDVAGFTAALGDPQKAVIIARVQDEDGKDVANAWVKWIVSDPAMAKVGVGETPTLDLGSFGIGAPQVVCGLAGTGEFELTLEIVFGPQGLLALDPAFHFDSFTFPMTLVGEPANISMTAAPAQLNCDGVVGSTVSATVTDADGNLAVNGTEVRFNVQVLGTANPIVATTADGVATSNIVPLAVRDTGVPVVATSGNASGSVLVACGQVAGGEAPPPNGGAAPTQPPTGTVRPPDTGSGQPLDHHGPLNVWIAVALFVGAMGLVGARVGLRRL
jgi:hypothetical protein